jgi:2-methylisocitrate lyase-like PEP mutase family enzyme
MVDKIKAAVDARRDGDTMIVARTDARATQGFKAAVERAAAFAEAGADILFVEALTSQEELRDAVVLLGDVPLILNIVFGGKTPPMDLAELDAIGYRFALYANAALQSAMWGMQHVLGELKREGSLEGVKDSLASFAERQRIIRKAEFDALEARFVRSSIGVLT